MPTGITTVKFRVVAVSNRFSRPLKQWLDTKAQLGERRHTRSGAGPGFWLQLGWQTFGRRDILALCDLMRDKYQVRGLEFVPADGVFTLAVNHTLVRWTPHLLSTIHQAVQARRPDLARDWLVIVGYREADLQKVNPVVRYLIPKIRRVHTWIFQRWSHNVLRLPTGNERVSLEALRSWKNRAQLQPTLVFPEGRGRDKFGPIRPGAGRWLAKLAVPVLPVSVWWDDEAQLWQLIFGPPIEWSANPQLHDLQIGLEIAEWLPPELAPEWQDFLRLWQEAN